MSTERDEGFVEALDAVQASLWAARSDLTSMRSHMVIGMPDTTPALLLPAGVPGAPGPLG